jgi:pimeloyl-ACP methyl ester carboxylesterase
MATRRPELLRSLCAHEPPLLGVVPDHPVVRQTREGVRPVLQLIDEDRREEAAEHFVERVALGPGIWPMMRARERETMIRNAHTFAAEMRDPGGVTVDLDALSGLHAPVLFTQGDQSPPFYAAVIARLAEAIDGAEVRTFTGAGHVPHITHSAEYVGAVTAFARAAAGSVR